jgi:hypothetical protein
MRAYFTYDGVVARIRAWLADPWRGELSCAPKPARFGHTEEAPDRA